MSISLQKEVIQGTNRHYRLTFSSVDLITDDNPQGRVDLTGATVYYRWKQKQSDPNPAELVKSSADVDEIEILSQTLDPYTLGQADVYLIPADTASLTPGWHYWDAWAELIDGTRVAMRPQKVYLIDAVTDLTPPSPNPSSGPSDGDDIVFLDRSFSLAHQETSTAEISLGRVPVGFSVVGLTAEVADTVSAGTVTVNVKVNSGTVLTVELDSVTNPIYDLDQALTGDYSVGPTDTLTLELIVAGYENAGAAASTLEVNVALARAMSYSPIITPDGGLAIPLLNKTGADSVRGTVVEASDTTDDAVKLCEASGDHPIGVVYTDGIADGGTVYVVVSGIADVLLKDSTAATRGYWVSTADVAGRADATNASPPGVVLSHFREIGHCIESKGAGSDVLARCVLHFN